MADLIQAKWLQDIKKGGDSVSSKAKGVSSQKQASKKPIVKPVSPVLLISPVPAVGKKTVTAISFDIFKTNTAASLPKIKKSDKPIVRKSSEVSPTATEPPSTEGQRTSMQQSEDLNNKFSYRRAEQVEKDSKHGIEDDTTKPRKKRKTVRFKPEDSIREIRYYVPDSSEVVIIVS